MNNSSGRIQAWAELAGITPAGYNETFMLFADSQGYAAGSFNERMVTYLRDINASSSPSLPTLEALTAETLGVYSWNEVGYDIIGLSVGVVNPPPAPSALQAAFTVDNEPAPPTTLQAV